MLASPLYLPSALSLQRLWFYIQDSMSTLASVHAITYKIQENSMRGCEVMSLLHERTHSSVRYEMDPSIPGAADEVVCGALSSTNRELVLPKEELDGRSRGQLLIWRIVILSRFWHFPFYFVSAHCHLQELASRVIPAFSASLSHCMDS